MAIVKMKRLRLLGMRADRERMLGMLQRLGCVEVDELDLDRSIPEWAALTRPDGQALAAARDEQDLLGSALSSLNKREKPKGRLLSARRRVSPAQLFDDGAYAAGLEWARTIVDTERSVAALVARQGEVRGRQTALTPWLALDVPLELEGDETVSWVFGTAPSGVELAELERALATASELACLFSAADGRQPRSLLLLCHASVETTCLEAMGQLGFSPAHLRGWRGTAADNYRALDRELEELEEQVARAEKQLASLASQRELLERCADRCAQEIAREEAKGRLLDTADTFLLEGWVPARDVRRLETVVVSFGCAYELSDPVPEEYSQVPVRLENGRLTRCMNMVTEMYSLPRYGSVDPNPLMAPFFILFYGIMMADMGYGLLMILGGGLILKRGVSREGMRNFGELLLYCGISTFGIGAATGAFFGDFLPRLARLIDPDTTFTTLPALFTPLEDTMAILVGALALGFVQIVTGQAVSFVQKIRDGRGRDALWDELPWWVIYLGVGLLALDMGRVAGYPVVLLIGILMMVYGSSRRARGLGKIGAVIGAVYSGVTGIFGDVLSYSRLMALMLSGSIIASVFNTLGSITGNVAAFVLIAMAGNLLNFALNLLGCYVHDLRLQCLEFFKAFYRDGGVPFRPLRVETTYVELEEEHHHVG